jgi:integrase
MATYAKRNGKIRVQVRINGLSKSATFDTKSEAQLWAALQERGSVIADNTVTEQVARGKYCPTNFAEILIKYQDKVTALKKTAKAEDNMISILLKASFMSIPVQHLTTEHFTDYRDLRLRIVKPSTVSRHFDILRRAAKVAEQEWNWVSPVEALSRCRTIVPQPTAVRRIDDALLDLLRASANRSRVIYLRPAIELALVTGMRRSELAKLQWEDVNLAKCLLTVRDTKTGYDRTIPLPAPAIEALELLGPSKGSVLGCTASALTQAWRRCKKRAGVKIRFHDLRHEACSRLFEMGFSPIEVASISGHRTLSQLMRYSHASQDAMLARMNEVLS